MAGFDPSTEEVSWTNTGSSATRIANLGTVQRPDVVQGAREAGFDVVIACAFNYESHATLR